MTVSPVFAWDKSMGMRHPDRPCMKNGLLNPRNGCGPDRRHPARIASDPYDCNNPTCLAASIASKAAGQHIETVKPLMGNDGGMPQGASGGEVAQVNKRIAAYESQVATLTTTNAQLQEQLKAARVPAPLASVSPTGRVNAGSSMEKYMDTMAVYIAMKKLCTSASAAEVPAACVDEGAVGAVFRFQGGAYMPSPKAHGVNKWVK